MRCGAFIAKTQSIICGSDDLNIYHYNYNTLEKLVSFEAHSDYIRCLAVHPTLSLVLSCSDDMIIKLWDWEKHWSCVRSFEGHSYFVMSVCWNPKVKFSLTLGFQHLCIWFFRSND